MIPRADRKIENLHIVGLMRELARRALDVIDLLDAFRELGTAEFRVSPWDLHPSVRGHQALFESFRAALLRRGGLPNLPFPDAR